MKPKIISGPGGLNILICHKPDSLSTTFLILVKAGTDLEKKNINGISHFIEHLYFKGTKNFPTPKILMENIDKIGGIFNAFTSYQYTGFYIRVLPEFDKEALFILSDIILEPLFPEEEIEKERKVIFEEINLHNDSPPSLIVDLGIQLTFGEQPAGWSILGNKKTLAKITRADILNYVKENYSTKNTLIILSGNLKRQEQLINFIKERFVAYNSKKPKAIFKFKKPKVGYQEKIYHKQVDQAHIFLGLPLPGMVELKDRRYLWYLISLILGEKPSSRLWLKIREELGAAYYLRSHFSEYTNRSLFFIHAGINLDKLNFVLETIIAEINKLKSQGVSEEELQTAKSVLKSSLFMDLEDSFNLAFFYGRQYLLEKSLISPEEIIKKIDALKIAHLQKELKNLFQFKQTKFAVILPKGHQQKFTKIFQKLIK